MSDYLLSFVSTHAALAAQSAFKKAELPFTLIPTPGAISAGCGMTLRFQAQGDGAAVRCLVVCAAQRETARLFRESETKELVPVEF